jgi:hypothetical protein
MVPRLLFALYIKGCTLGVHKVFAAGLTNTDGLNRIGRQICARSPDLNPP